MPSYSTPGVYVEEVSTLPPSVAPVATAIPVFIGYTEKAQDATGADLTDTPVRITSALEYETLFGRAPLQAMSVNVAKRVNSSGGLIGVNVSFNTALPDIPTQLMHYSILHYYANGGGPCYIYSVGGHGAASQGDFTAAIGALEAVDEPTLLVFPDAAKLTNAQHGNVVVAALQSCSKTQDRFTIADVRNALPGGTVTNANVTSNFRNSVGLTSVDFLKYGAAYFPYLRTLLPWRTDDASITVNTFDDVTVADDGTETTTNNATLSGATLGSAGIRDGETAVYNAIKAFLSSAYVTLPPSAAVAGVYARVDRTRGVWKAPANVGIAAVTGTALPITNDLNDGLNIDPGSGKSINAIRSFAGRGTLVWGARTLAGNDNEYRYVPVRRFLNFAEESIKKAIGAFVFEPNDANTWVKVRSMIENFLILQWRDGALAGAKPEHAFGVSVGLNKTMTPDDILNGYMIVRVELAIVRPAEFIVLVFSQKMQES